MFKTANTTMKNKTTSAARFFNAAGHLQTNPSLTFEANLDSHNGGVGPLLGASITYQGAFPEPVDGHIVGFSSISRFDKFGYFALFGFYSECLQSMRLIYVDLNEHVLVANDQPSLTAVEAADIKRYIDTRDCDLISRWKNTGGLSK